jgi:hypothetical protein
VDLSACSFGCIFGVDFSAWIFRRGFFGVDFSAWIFRRGFVGVDFSAWIFQRGFFSVDFSAWIFQRGFLCGFLCGFLRGFLCGFLCGFLVDFYDAIRPMISNGKRLEKFTTKFTLKFTTKFTIQFITKFTMKFKTKFIHKFIAIFEDLIRCIRSSLRGVSGILCTSRGPLVELLGRLGSYEGILGRPGICVGGSLGGFVGAL